MMWPTSIVTLWGNSIIQATKKLNTISSWSWNLMLCNSTWPTFFSHIKVSFFSMDSDRDEKQCKSVNRIYSWKQKSDPKSILKVVYSSPSICFSLWVETSPLSPIPHQDFRKDFKLRQFHLKALPYTMECFQRGLRRFSSGDITIQGDVQCCCFTCPRDFG